MASKPGLLEYVTAAFNARPLGMFVAPNWVGLAAFGLLGLTNPGFWVLGAGLELGYLLTLATNARFQRAVSSGPLSAARAEWNQRIERLSNRLNRGDRERFSALSQRCASIIDLQTHGGAETPHGIETQADSLGRLSWMFLRLLVARSTILDVLGGGEDDGTLEQRRRALERQANDDQAPADLRRSLAGQLEILAQRIEQREEAEKKLAFIDAELARIEEQVELIREQAALSTDPEILSRRIDEIAATLGGTGQWIRDQQKVYGAMEDLLTEPPPLTTGARAKESQ
ncbi:MAG TPA: hypothetical protein VJ813_15615 [Vicinamibacterales bacterium]|nr:hypothetical protein [Vicinamibacterales bacterium]